MLCLDNSNVSRETKPKHVNIVPMVAKCFTLNNTNQKNACEQVKTGFKLPKYLKKQANIEKEGINALKRGRNTLKRGGSASKTAFVALKWLGSGGKGADRSDFAANHILR